MKLETDLGFRLVNSLSTDQLKLAMFSDNAPKEIITGTQRKVENIEPKGISYESLTADQMKIFM